MEKLILTISLLCSGREDTTEKCLASLDHLRKAVPSELIITDTGCPASVKAILEKYGDRVLPFTWIDDFSAARNVGVRAARGEWFFYLDDDEWFENTDAIEAFFLSGEYKHFDAAYYQTRDYQSLAKDDFKITNNLRMFSLANGAHFESRIHEQIQPARKQIKMLTSYTHHLGYVYETPEKKRAHYERNLRLLQEELGEHPGDVSILAHLANEYRASEEYDSLKKICREALTVCETSGDDRVWVARPTFLYGVLECTYREGTKQENSCIEEKNEERPEDKYKEGLMLCRKYEEISDLTEPARASIYYFGALFANRLSQGRADAFERDERAGKADGRGEANHICCEYCDKYLQLYQACAQDQVLLQKQFSFFCEAALEEEAYQNITRLQQCAQLKINIQALLDRGMSGLAEPMIQLILKLYPEDGQARDWLTKEFS